MISCLIFKLVCKIQQKVINSLEVDYKGPVAQLVRAVHS